MLVIKFKSVQFYLKREEIIHKQTMISIRYSALLLLAIGTVQHSTYAQDAPSNDSCESATEVTTFPFTDSGSLADASIDNTFNSTCMGGWDGSDVWYIFPELTEGTELQVTIGGIGAEVQGQILASNDELGSCPDNFLCPGAITMTSSINTDGSTGGSIWFTAEKDSFYYLVLYSTSSDGGPDFEVSVDIVVTSATTTVATEAQEPVSNDTCENAMEVTTFPLTVSGAFPDGTKDNFSSTCLNYSGPDIWYVFPDVSEGTVLTADITGVDGEVQGFFMLSNDDLGPCPDEFLCPSNTWMISGMGSDLTDMVNSAQTSMTAEKDSFIYLVLHSSNGTSFELSVDVGTSTSTTVATIAATAADTESQEPPPNNYCESATEVTTFPFTDSGSLANATQESLNISCFGGWEGTDVWYVLPDVSEGTEYEVSMMGIGGEVQGWVLKSNDELGSCPEEWLCPDAIQMTSSIDPTGSTQSRIIWTAEKDSFYYVALYATSNTTGPDFEISFDTLEPIPDTASTPAPAPTDKTATSSGYKMIGSVGAALLVSVGLLSSVCLFKLF